MNERTIYTYTPNQEQGYSQSFESSNISARAHALFNLPYRSSLASDKETNSGRYQSSDSEKLYRKIEEMSKKQESYEARMRYLEIIIQSLLEQNEVARSREKPLEARITSLETIIQSLLEQNEVARGQDKSLEAKIEALETSRQDLLKQNESLAKRLNKIERNQELSGVVRTAEIESLLDSIRSNYPLFLLVRIACDISRNNSETIRQLSTNLTKANLQVVQKEWEKYIGYGVDMGESIAGFFSPAGAIFKAATNIGKKVYGRDLEKRFQTLIDNFMSFLTLSTDKHTDSAHEMDQTLQLAILKIAIFKSKANQLFDSSENKKLEFGFEKEILVSSRIYNIPQGLEYIAQAAARLVVEIFLFISSYSWNLRQERDLANRIFKEICQSR